MTGLGLLRNLYPSVGEHRAVEKKTRRLLEETLPEAYVGPVGEAPALRRYVEKNAFSILFLAVYRALGIPRERRILYGVINHAIRGIVTGTDNLLDDEYKEMLPLRLPARATRFRSVLHILLFDRFLSRTVEEAVGSGLLRRADAAELEKRVFHAMVPIGAEEASEEGGVAEFLPPEEILSTVHMHKGGNLLRLAFVAPRFVERDRGEALEVADRGIYRIGLALQVIDDLTDFYDDVRDRRHNYLASSVWHEGSADERRTLEVLCQGGSAPQPQPSVAEIYPASTARTMRRAVGEALAGFEFLRAAGFWVDRPAALGLIRRLFRLRGVGELLSLLPDDWEETLTGAERPGPSG